MTPAQLRRALLPPLCGAGLLALLGALLGARSPWTLVTLAFGGYALQVTFDEMLLPVRQRFKAGAGGLGSVAVDALLVRGRRRFGAYVVHAGAAVIIVAIAVSSTMGSSREVQIKLGESVQVGRYTLTFLGVHQVREPHRSAVVARVALKRGATELGELQPRMNQYDTQREPIGTPAVRTFLFEDVYLSIMNVAPSGQSLGLLALVNPMVGWIWIATGMMALGGLIALVPWRRPRSVVVRAEAPAAGFDVAAQGSR